MLPNIQRGYLSVKRCHKNNSKRIKRIMEEEGSDSKGTSPDVGADALTRGQGRWVANVSSLASMRSSSPHPSVDVPAVPDSQNLHRFRLIINVIEHPDVTNPYPPGPGTKLHAPFWSRDMG